MAFLKLATSKQMWTVPSSMARFPIVWDRTLCLSPIVRVPEFVNVEDAFKAIKQ
jgi:hypothetical protein